MNFKQIGLVAIAFFSAIAPVMAMAPAQAAIPTGLFKDAEGNLFLMNQTPGAEVVLTYNSVAATRNLTATACGLVSIRPTATNPVPDSFSVGSNIVVVGSLPVQTKPGCTGGQLAEARPNHFKTAEGEVVLVGQSGTVTIGFTRNRDRKAKANACGIVRFGNSQSYQHTDTTQVQLGTSGAMSIKQIDTNTPALCRQGTLYIPASWIN